MKSWRMTISGLVTSCAGLIVLLSTQGVAEPHWLVVTAGFVGVGGFASLGINGKDSNVHSTVAEVQQSTQDAKDAAAK
jgi:hypothetical protein